MILNNRNIDVEQIGTFFLKLNKTLKIVRKLFNMEQMEHLTDWNNYGKKEIFARTFGPHCNESIKKNLTILIRGEKMFLH